MIGWFTAAVMTIVAAAALGLLWRRHRREVHRLRHAHQQAIQRHDEHRRQVDRLRREQDRQLQTAHHSLAEDLLPVVDSLQQAGEHCDDGAGDEQLREGIEIAAKALVDAFKRHGITAIEPQPGDPFDPTVHEAISTSSDDDAEPGTIRRRFRRGYQSDQRVLRPAMVEVNAAPDQREEPEDEEEDGDDSSDADASSESETGSSPEAPSPSDAKDSSSPGTEDSSPMT